MIKTITRVGLVLSLLVSIAATTVQAGQSNDNKTVLTFNQPVEVSGYVLPAGKYTFQLADSLTDRHIVLIFDANSNLVATVMAIPNYRFRTSDDAVVKFGDLPVGSPDVVRAWFYPGASIREEFVYPKPRAAELAKAAHAPVPAIAAAATDTELLKTAPVVAITPDEKEIPITAAIQTTPVANVAVPASVPSVPSAVGTTGVMPPAKSTRPLPHTASPLPLIALVGSLSIGVAFVLMVFGKRRQPAAIL